MNPNNKVKIFRHRFTEVVLVIFHVIYLYICYKFVYEGLDRGFDWTDEAWVFQVSRNWSREPGSLTLFNYLTHLFLLISFGDVLTLRILRVAVYLITSYLFAHIALRNFVPTKFEHSERRIVAILIASFCTLLAFSYPPRYISYNELSSWIISLILITYCMLAKSSDHRRLTKKGYILQGLLNALLLFVKFPVGIAFIFINLLIIAVQDNNSSSYKIRKLSICSFVFGFSITAILVQVGTGNAWSYFRDVGSVLFSSHEQSKYDHETLNLLKSYSFQLTSVGENFGLKLVIPLFLAFLILKRSEKSNLIKVKTTWSIMAALALLLFIHRFPIVKKDFLSSAGNWIVALTLMNTFVLLLLLNARKMRVNNFLCLMVFSWSPIISGLGTNNNLGGQAIFAISGLIVSTTLLISFFFDLTNLRTVLLFLLVATMSFTPSVVYANTQGLYRVAPVEKLNWKIQKIESLKHIFVTKSESELYKWLFSVEESLKQDTRIISVQQPGFSLAFEGRNFGPKWIDSFIPVSFVNLEKACRNNKQEGAIAVVTPTVLSPQILLMLDDAIRSCNIAFPGSFQILSHSPDQSVVVWISTD